MKTRLPRTIAVLAWLAVAVAPAACSDRNPLGGVPRPTPGGGKIVSELHCTASRSGHLDCREVGSGTTGADHGTPRVILGGGKVKLRSRNPHYDSATHVFEFEVNLQNLLTEPIGTPDGTTAAGSKVFYYTAPYVSSYSAPGDTGSVTVTNADGYGNFTGPHQAYYTYPQILQPQDSTPYKRWELKFPPSVNTFSFALKVFTWIASEPPVPIRAPHGAPAWFYAAANQQDCVGVIAGKCVRNVVQLLFKPTATAEERITALNSVGGVVVGGDSAVNIYYVKVSGDSTTAGLQTALSVLRSLPQVARAHAYSAELPTGEYRKPYDAQAWREWKLSPDSADGENWGLERVAAPYAWGCSTGEGARVAVVDNGFFPISDLMENTTISHGVGSFSNSLDDHGNRVAGLVAARGNDSSHVTGMMWRADLRLYDFHVSPTGAHVAGQEAELWSTMMRAAMEGARVINISVGMRWRDIKRIPYDPALETRPVFQNANRHLVATWFAGLRTRMDSLAARGIYPLVVFSAGNEAIGAEWNMARIAADSFPNQVIVVGASTAADALGSNSNRGHLVQVVAPGEDVYVLRGDSTVVKGPPGSGTSFAAPLVTGAAGLLLSFDSTLTAGELKEAIIQGAIRGGRTAGGIPLLNVHESLKYVAERPGAPLCGNRLWVDGTSLVAARGSATPTPLFQVGDAPGSFQALHGGRQVRFYDYMLGSDRLFQWSAAGWAERTIPGTQSDSVFGPRNEGPVYRGYRGVSHNADSVAYTTTSATGFTVMVADTVTWNWQTRADILVARNQSQPNTCIRRYTGDTITAPSCVDSVGVGTVHSDGFSLPAYSPRGDRVYVSVPRTTTTGSTSGSWVICPGQNLSKLPMNHQECIGTSGTTSWASSTIYRVNAHAQGYAVFKTVSGHVDEITPGDGGQEMTVHATTYTITCTGTWVFENGRLGMQSSCAPVVPSCTVQFWHERSGNTLAASPVVCNNAVTFAPVRAAGIGTATARARQSPARVPLPGPGAWLTGSARVPGTTRG